MQAGLDAFSRQAEEVVNTFARAVDAAPPPKTIYHYTDGAGLRGIIEAGKFWFTDIFNLNDPSELRYGLQPAMEAMQREVAKGVSEVGTFSRTFMEMLRGEIERVAHYFVCCFSTAGDDLGQWRAYADNGRGYAIGFDGKVLEQAFAKPGGVPIPNNATYPLTYGDIELRRMLDQIIQVAIPLISLPRGRALSDPILKQFMSELAINLAVPIFRAALFFKHEAYRNEAEYRFLQVFRRGPVPDLRYRGRPYSLIRYREFDWRSVAPDALKEIVIGPSADRRLAPRFVDDCLRAFHPAASPTVRQSPIPYRAP